MTRNDQPGGLPPSVIERLKERHEFDTWRERNRLDQNLFIWNVPPTTVELPAWQRRRSQELDDPQGPRLLNTLWARAGARQALALDLRECESRLAAHEWLIRTLGEFQSPLIGRDEQVDVGDVAFSGPERAVVVFARANLVCALRNAGREVISVTDFARQLDRFLLSEPAPDDHEAELETGVPMHVGSSISLTIQARDPRDTPVLYKFFSRRGEVLIEDGRLRYRPHAPEPHDIRVYAVSSPNAASRCALRLGEA